LNVSDPFADTALSHDLSECARGPETSNAPPFGQVRILIVEDHEALSMGLERYLVSSGHLVTTADSITAAVNCAKNGQFDLILIDLQLPDGTGWDLLEKLSDKNPVRAIAMSGWGNASDVAKSETTGFIRHLMKPITPEELSAAILYAMDHPVAFRSTPRDQQQQKRSRRITEKKKKQRKA